MPLPKVVFQTVPLQLEIEWMYGFLFNDKWGWERIVLKKHPKLKGVYKYSKEVERKKFLKDYITNFRAKHKAQIDKKTTFHQKNWQKIEAKYLTVLSEVMETPWPNGRRRIKAYISVNPICPRFIDDWSFFFAYDSSLKLGREIIMHEICHFLYFKKWKEVLPRTNKRKFDYPYLEWHLSELLAPIILGDPRIQKILRKQPFFYEEHKVIKIGSVSAPEYFAEIYKNSRKNNESFASLLKESFNSIRKVANKFDD